MKECFNYWHEVWKTSQNQYWNHEENKTVILAKARASEIKEELNKNKNIKICSDECQPFCSNLTSTNSEKSQLRQYLIKNGISKISL